VPSDKGKTAEIFESLLSEIHQTTFDSTNKSLIEIEIEAESDSL